MCVMHVYIIDQHMRACVCIMFVHAGMGARDLNM